MTRIAITGHRGLPPTTEKLIDQALRLEISKRADGNLIGITCLADGADTLFARAILDHGGQLHVVVPAQKYRDSLPTEHHSAYDTLISNATEVNNLDHIESDSEAYMDASLRMLDEADELLAVWDGNPARGYGGTADVVAVARDAGYPVTIVWPTGAARD